jgi:hypothetical protein
VEGGGGWVDVREDSRGADARRQSSAKWLGECHGSEYRQESTDGQ